MVLFTCADQLGPLDPCGDQPFAVPFLCGDQPFAFPFMPNANGPGPWLTEPWRDPVSTPSGCATPGSRP